MTESAHIGGGSLFMVGGDVRVSSASVVAGSIGLAPGQVVVLQEIDMTTRAETLFWVRPRDSKRPAVPVFAEDLENL